MAKELNFNTVKKPTWKVTLNDENKTVLFLKIADKGTIAELISRYQNFDTESLDADEFMSDMYELCAQLLSCNKVGKTFTSEDLQEIWEIDDILIFIRGYVEFISEVTNQKN